MFDEKKYEGRMKSSIDHFSENLQNIRAGRANPKLIEKITFSYYGVDTPINQAATINVPEARMLTITPWDKNNVKSIEKAILSSELGITPSNDGTMIRLPFPALTEERRKELVKEVSGQSEEAKIAIRNIRREAMDEIKKAEKNKEMSEDDRYVEEEAMQKLTDKYIEEIEKIGSKKEKELMEI